VTHAITRVFDDGCQRAPRQLFSILTVVSRTGSLE
jgi:hypothetical protein